MPDEKTVPVGTTTETVVSEKPNLQEVLTALTKENESRRKRSSEDAKVLQEKEEQIKTLLEKITNEESLKNQIKEKEMKEKEQYKELSEKIEKEKQEAIAEREKLKKDLEEASKFKNEILKKENELHESILAEVKKASETQNDASILAIGEQIKDNNLLKEYLAKITTKPQTGIAYDKPIQKVGASGEVLTARNLDSNKLDHLLKLRELNPDEYNRQLEAIKDSGWRKTK